MITLHHLVQSRSNRIAWLLEALELPYQISAYQRDPKTYGAPESLKQVSPLGKAPVISDDELVIAESGAIIEYLIDNYDEQQQFRPKDGQALLDYRYWLHFAEGSMMPLLVMRLVLNKSLEKPMPFFAKPIIRKFVDGLNNMFIEPRIVPQLQQVEQHLAKHTWFAGEQLSGADFQMMLVLQLAAQRCDMSPYSQIKRYMQQIEKIESYQRAMKKLAAAEAGE